MHDNQERLKHGRMAKHTFIWREKDRTPLPEIGATSLDTDTSSFRVHVSPSLSSQRHESPIIAHDTLEVQPATMIPNVFLGAPLDTLPIYMCAYYASTHMCYGEVK